MNEVTVYRNFFLLYLSGIIKTEKLNFSQCISVTYIIVNVVLMLEIIYVNVLELN